jgi:hypothetical protein
MGEWFDNRINGKVSVDLKLREYTHGLMEEDLKVNGETTTCMDMESIHGKMGGNMKESIY